MKNFIEAKLVKTKWKMNKDATVQQTHEGYAIELNRKNLTKDKKFYFFDVCVAGSDAGINFPIEDPRTLIYNAVSVSPKERIDQDILFFENKMDAADVVTLIKTYQAYDEKLCGPFKKGYKFIPKVVKIKSCQKYSDLKKDFLDKNNHMDFNLEQDKAKKWLDEYVAKANEKVDV